MGDLVIDMLFSQMGCQNAEHKRLPASERMVHVVAFIEISAYPTGFRSVAEP